MLSILIPVYNFDVTDYVKGLWKQAENSGRKYEIILADDASDLKYRQLNQELQKYENIQFIPSERNIGRSRIRNFLAKQAKYEYLIFTDCDSGLVSDDYLEKYLALCRGEIVVSGGRLYPSEKPDTDKNTLLQWTYGTKRETAEAAQRNKKPNASFMTNNFLISKSLFQKISFDESLTKYGHEDTLFGYELKRMGVKVKHINNPIRHIGLDENRKFLNNTKRGVENLKYIAQNYDYPELYRDIKLLKVYQKIAYWRGMLAGLYTLFAKPIEAQLNSASPSLLLFDMYKLGYLCKIS